MNNGRAQLQETKFVCEFTTVGNIRSTSAKSDNSASADDIASTEEREAFQLKTASE
jgi:hypothetical protein